MAEISDDDYLMLLRSDLSEAYKILRRALALIRLARKTAAFPHEIDAYDKLLHFEQRYGAKIKGFRA